MSDPETTEAEMPEETRDPLYTLAGGIDLAPGVRAEIETAADLAQAAAAAAAISQQLLLHRQIEMDEIKDALERAEARHAAELAKRDTLERQLVIILQASGLVRTAGGITYGQATAAARDLQRQQQAAR